MHPTLTTTKSCAQIYNSWDLLNPHMFERQSHGGAHGRGSVHVRPRVAWPPSSDVENVEVSWIMEDTEINSMARMPEKASPSLMYKSDSRL